MIISETKVGDDYGSRLADAAVKVGKYRWRIVALLFFATTINYIDRNVLSFTMLDDGFRRSMLGLDGTGPLDEGQIKTFKTMMGQVDAAFKIAYALGFVLVGWMIDKIGTKKGFSISIIVWSLAGILNGFVTNVKGLFATRFMLGIGEAGNFPSAVKSVAEWFPKKERAFATGVFNAGANIGIILTALCVPLITINYGWRAAFIITGLLGVILLFFWWTTYNRPEEHPKVSEGELAYIRSGQDDVDTIRKITWARLLPYRQTWAFALAKFLTDGVWWFYLTWLPDFFNSNAAFETRLDLKSVGIPFLVIYLVSDGGSIFYGWLSSRFIKNGWSVNAARKVTMLICAATVIPIFFAAQTSSIVIAIILVSIATAAHQGFSANLFTLTSDMFPKQAVGSVVGIGGMMGAIGGALIAYNAGSVIANVGYLPLFIYAGTAYLLAVLIIHLLAPRLQQVQFKEVD
ncbi:MAG TPA: MFS transporter [Flavisolibacter sp.]|nr:MFS transporter [Flavisolibacter sp.]